MSNIQNQPENFFNYDIANGTLDPKKEFLSLQEYLPNGVEGIDFSNKLEL